MEGSRDCSYKISSRQLEALNTQARFYAKIRPSSSVWASIGALPLKSQDLDVAYASQSVPANTLAALARTHEQSSYRTSMSASSTIIDHPSQAQLI